MISVLASRGGGGRSANQTKTINLVFVASPLNTQHCSIKYKILDLDKGKGRKKGCRRHRRAGKGKKKKATSHFNINILNIRGMKSKVHEVNKHIADNFVDIFCLAETFRR